MWGVLVNSLYLLVRISFLIDNVQNDQGFLLNIVTSSIIQGKKLDFINRKQVETRPKQDRTPKADETLPKKLWS